MSGEVNRQLIQGHAYLRQAWSNTQLGTKSGVNIQEKAVPTKDCSMESYAEHTALDRAKRSFGWTWTPCLDYRWPSVAAHITALQPRSVTMI